MNQMHSPDKSATADEAAVSDKLITWETAATSLARISPPVAGIIFALAGAAIWFILESVAASLNAGSDTRTTDGVFVILLALQSGYYLAVRPQLQRAGLRCVAELRPVLQVSDDVLEGLTSHFSSLHPLQLGTAAAAAAVLTTVLQEVQMQRFSHWLASPGWALGEAWTVFAAWSTWTLGLAAAATMINDANLVRRMGREWISVDLMRAERLTAFSRYGLSLAGAVVGLMALWAMSLVIINAAIGVEWAQSSGQIGLLMVALYIALSVTAFVFPQLGVRNHIRHSKAQACAEITHLLPHSAQILDEARARPERLGALLDSRRHIQAIPEWPAGQHTHIRLALYLLVPLLSWSAAAMVEEILSRFLW